MKKPLKSLLMGVKYLFWVILAWLIVLILLGFVKHKSGVGEYVEYLNQKDWKEISSEVHLRNPLDWMNFFWGEVETGSVDQNSGVVLLEDGVEEFDISGVVVEDQIDLFDESVEEDFQEFFDREDEVTQENTGVNLSGEGEFGFSGDFEKNDNGSGEREIDDSVLMQLLEKNKK